jgi:putative ABC transport system substrate-binding protein
MAACFACAAAWRAGLSGGPPSDRFAGATTPSPYGVRSAGLWSLGYRIGENVVIEYRFANGEMERLPALAADLVRLGVDIIVAIGNPNTVAAMKATTTIPIVMTGADPVSTGLVASLARPGGNVTGLAVDTGGEILGKRFELLKETLPNLARLGILFNPDVAFTRTRRGRRWRRLPGR